LRLEGCQKLVRNRSPFTGDEPEQMPVAGNAMDQFEAGVAAGRGERLIVFADQP
jgi:hypothetical protein